MSDTSLIVILYRIIQSILTRRPGTHKIYHSHTLDYICRLKIHPAIPYYRLIPSHKLNRNLNSCYYSVSWTIITFIRKQRRRHEKNKTNSRNFISYIFSRSIYYNSCNGNHRPLRNPEYAQSIHFCNSCNPCINLDLYSDLQITEKIKPSRTKGTFPRSQKANDFDTTSCRSHSLLNYIILRLLFF